MPVLRSILIHESQWPASLTQQLKRCLLTRRINHKFHYDSPQQVRQWLRLHEAYSPARRDQDFRETYLPAFASAASRLGGEPVHVVALGCGGGQKEAALLGHLSPHSRRIQFTATDVSVGMVEAALEGASQHVGSVDASGLVCDLVEMHDLNEFLQDHAGSRARRIITCFGLIPNFEPDVIRRLLQRVLRPGDLLLSSANLAPDRWGEDADRGNGVREPVARGHRRAERYRRGVEAVKSQYDNTLTCEWLAMLLEQLGLEPGRIRFRVEEVPEGSGFLRIAAHCHFERNVTAVVEGQSIDIDAGEDVQLFFSYRHTSDTLGRLFSAVSLHPGAAWISSTGEEGVFLASAAADPATRSRVAG